MKSWMPPSLHALICLCSADTVIHPTGSCDCVHVCSTDEGLPVLQDIPQIIKHCKVPGPLSFTALSEEELRLLNNLMGRLYQLAEAAAAVRAPPCSHPVLHASDLCCDL